MSRSLINSFITEVLEVVRSEPGKFLQRGKNRGQFVSGKTRKLKIKASVQPNDPNEVILEGSHDRTQGSVKIYTFERLRTKDEKLQIPADVICHDGKRYEVFRTQNWTTASGSFSTDLPHYKCVAFKIDGEGGGNASSS